MSASCITAVMRCSMPALCSSVSVRSCDGVATAGVATGKEARKSSRPEPAKSPRRQQTVDEPIKRFLERHTPGLTFPDAVDQRSQTESQKRGSAGDAKHGQIWRARHHRASREISDEDADKQAIGEPHAEELGHGHR